MPADGAEAEAGSKDGEGETTPPASGRASAVKGWSDAVSAVLKAVLMMLGCLAAIIVAASVVWREFSKHTIAVRVDSATERALIHLGTDIDIASMLVDDLNENIRGVTQIIRVSNGERVLAKKISEESNISLKTFGVEVETDDILQMIRVVFGLPPPYSVVISLQCEKDDCEAASKVPADKRKDALLLVKLDVAGSIKRLPFRISLSGTALRRGLKTAMRLSSEKLLELADPVLAADFYLNAPRFIDPFFIETNEDLGRVTAASFKARQLRGDHCLPDVLLADSMYEMGDTEGAELLSQLSRENSPDSTCYFYININRVILLNAAARCLPEMRERFLGITKAALDRLGKRNQFDEDDLIAGEYIIIKLFRIVGDAARANVCWRAQSLDKLSPESFQKLRNLLEEFQTRLPPGSKRESLMLVAHFFLEELSLLLENYANVRDFRSNQLAFDLNRAIEKYLAEDRRPRRLFVARGQVLMGLAYSGGADAEPDAQLAAIAFQNAANTEAAAPLIEQTSELEPRVLRGDAWLAAGRSDFAKAAYAEAVETFIDQDEPAAEFEWFARASAHWSALLVSEGSCKSGSQRQDWDRLGIQLGANPDYDLCAVFASPRETVADDKQKLGLIALVYDQIARIVASCGSQPADALDGMQRSRCFRETDFGPRWLSSAFPSRRSLDEQIDAILSKTAR